MRPNGPTFWQLDGRTGWRSAATGKADLSVSASGLRLPADPQGSLSLEGGLPSLGALTLPRGIAVGDNSRVFLLVRHRILRFSAKRREFQMLPAVGGQGDDPRRFDRPSNIAAAGDTLVVADTGNQRVQAFDQRTLTLLHVWQLEDWQPVDVTAQNGAIYILDGRFGRVYHHEPGTGSFTQVVAAQTAQPAGTRWSRLAVDRQGRIYILDSEQMHLVLFDPAGRRITRAGTGLQPGDVRDRFDRPQIILDAEGRFCLPQALAAPCPQTAESPIPQLPLGLCPPWQESGLLFNQQGERLFIDDPADVRPPRLYERSGVWYSAALDSRIYACQWDRLVIDAGTLPAGTRLTVETYTAGDLKDDEDIADLPDAVWARGLTLTGLVQPPPEAQAGESEQASDGLIQSHKGRYLWLRVHLTGDGIGTPVVRAIRAHYPRMSYLEYLPATFSEDEEGRWFLERFLAIFQAEWDTVEQRLETISRYFDPQAVPEKEPLAYLANWLALPLEGEWTEEQKRNMLVAAPEIYANRGTADSFRRYLQVYIQNITGLSPQEQGAYPGLVEGFRERDYFILREESHLGGSIPLWGPAKVGRLQLDVFAREGEVRLVSTGDPQRDIFDQFAHRFRVFMPSSWLPTASARRMIKRAIDSEKPAHTAATLYLVEPRLRVGRQASIGLDTIVGGYPKLRLACHDREEEDAGTPPAGRLGYDTVLSASPGSHARLSLGRQQRVGLDTVM